MATKKERPIGGWALPEPPPSNWTCPQDFPDLRGRGAKRFGIDIESKDPHLTTTGPGWMDGTAKVIGVAISTDDFSRYYPCGHEVVGHQQIPRNVLSRWLNDQLKGYEPKVGANLPYDLSGLLIDLGVHVNGPIIDIQVAEPLLDEESFEGYNLDALGLKYLGEAKEETLLLQACAAFGLGHIKKGVRKNYKNLLYVLPPRYVGPYAEDDATKPLKIWDKQEPLLRGEDLMRVWEIERKVTPITVEMHQHGVRVDTDRAEFISKVLGKGMRRMQSIIDGMAGFRCNINANDELKRVFDAAGQYYPNTKPSKLHPEGQASFTKDFLKESEFPFAKAVMRMRKLEKTKRDFVDGTILERNVKGRIHASWNQLRQDESGARSGRFSCTNPNLQQQSARDSFYGPLVRSMFIPEPGEQWASIDVSQQEFRWTVHYGYILGYDGAAEARDKYIENPKADFHQMVADLVGLVRKIAKEINLGLSYSMGIAKLAIKLSIALGRMVTNEEAKGYIDTYHSRMPFIKKLNQYASRLAQDRGWVKTALGRRRRFNLWEPSWKDDPSHYGTPLPLEKARERWPGVRLKRALTHKAYNAIDQGTSGDQLKIALVRCHEEGILIPLLVHDEGDISFSDPRIPMRVAHHLRTALPCEVPMHTDIEIGPNWGRATTKPDWAIAA